MTFATPATRHGDVPLIHVEPRRLPEPKWEPVPSFPQPIRVPVYVPVKKEVR